LQFQEKILAYGLHGNQCFISRGEAVKRKNVSYLTQMLTELQQQAEAKDRTLGYLVFIAALRSQDLDLGRSKAEPLSHDDPAVELGATATA
jgi:hypothetical protein